MIGKVFLPAALFACAVSATAAQAQTEPDSEYGVHEMKVRDLYPLVTTPNLAEVRDFYTEHFDFDVAFEANWFLYLTGPGEPGTRGATLAFLHPDHPSKPPGPETFDGLGMILTIEVSNATEVFSQLEANGAAILHPLTDEDWGQRRFMTRDPAGVLVDIVEQIEPKAGFWDPYMVPN